MQRMLKRHRGTVLAIGSLVLVLSLIVAWEASRPTSPASSPSVQASVAAEGAEMPRPPAASGLSPASSHPEGVASAPAPAASVASPSLGDRLAAGIEALPPEVALETARLLPRCSRLPLDCQLLDERLAREEAGAYKTKMLRDREALMALERNCQTLPADVRTLGDEFQLRSQLLRHAYAAHVPGAAVELLSLPQPFAGVPAGELKEQAMQDARAGDLPTLSAWVLLKAQADELETPDVKVYAFALQRAARMPELKEAVAPAQALYAQVLEQYWAQHHPDSRSAPPAGFNTDSQGVFLYPKGFDEPKDAAYVAQAKAMEAALIHALRRNGKPS